MREIFIVIFIFNMFFINCSGDSSTNVNDELRLSDVIIGDWLPAIDENFSKFEGDGIGFGKKGEVYWIDALDGISEPVDNYEKKLIKNATYDIKENNILIVNLDTIFIHKWDITIIDEKTLRSNYLELYPDGGGPKYMKPIGLIRKVSNQ